MLSVLGVHSWLGKALRQHEGTVESAGLLSLSGQCPPVPAHALCLAKRPPSFALICISMIINEVDHLSLGLLREKLGSGGAQDWS